MQINTDFLDHLKQKMRLLLEISIFQMAVKMRKLYLVIVIIIIIISQTANPTGKASSYEPKGTSRECNPVRKGKEKRLKREQ